MAAREKLAVVAVAATMGAGPTLVTGGTIASTGCVGVLSLGGEAWCALALKRSGTEPGTGARIAIVAPGGIEFEGERWPFGCVCLHPNDSDHVRDVEANLTPPTTEYENVLSHVASIVEEQCLFHAIGLLNPECDTNPSCLEYFHNFSKCPVQDFQENQFASAGGFGTGGAGDGPCTSGGDTGFGVATVAFGTLGYDEEPTGTYPNAYNFDDVVDCPGNARCLVDETFVAEMNATPTLINDDPGVVEFTVDGLEIVTAPNGSLANALMFQAGDIVISVAGHQAHQLTSFLDVQRAFVNIARENPALEVLTVKYKRPPSTKVKELTVQVFDLATYP